MPCPQCGLLRRSCGRSSRAWFVKTAAAPALVIYRAELALDEAQIADLHKQAKDLGIVVVEAGKSGTQVANVRQAEAWRFRGIPRPRGDRPMRLRFSAPPSTASPV